jgi:hypothetical protein
MQPELALPVAPATGVDANTPMFPEIPYGSSEDDPEIDG